MNKSNVKIEPYYAASTKTLLHKIQLDGSTKSILLNDDALIDVIRYAEDRAIYDRNDSK